jgi:regulator of protease activity HflC (stomatin/prohibitin superfamily)
MKEEMKMEKQDKVAVALGSVGFFAFSALIALGLWGCPKYKVYDSRQEGMANLAHAQFNAEVVVAEAKAKMEAAELLAQADVNRAKGAAQANVIIGSSLKNNEAYLRYLWIQNLENAKDQQVIYVPTEAGLPILEAGKRK